MHALPSNTLLGAILAGGQARRFGSDKALAKFGGQSLIAHAIAALTAQTHEVVICGRAWEGRTSLPDRPQPNLGPLGGLNAALHFAAAEGFGAVLTAGCDTPLLPPDLTNLLATGTGAAIVANMPVIGYWPTSLAPMLDAHLASSEDRSIRRWARLAGARFVDLDGEIPNINTPADLDAISAQS